jgi:hypothetical protein
MLAAVYDRTVVCMPRLISPRHTAGQKGGNPSCPFGKVLRRSMLVFSSTYLYGLAIRIA